MWSIAKWHVVSVPSDFWLWVSVFDPARPNLVEEGVGKEIQIIKLHPRIL